MRIKSLWIDKYKNLENFKIEFDTSNALNIIIGNNGSGKSTFLEAVSLIFISNFEEKMETDFFYTIEYIHYSDLVSIKYIDSKIEYKINNELVNKKKIRSKMPNNIFAYYSGNEKRLEKIYNDISLEKYKRDLLNEEEVRLRKMFFIEEKYNKISFIASEIYNTNAAKHIKASIGIEKASYIKIILKKPSWSKKSEDIFFDAKGSSRIFLNELERKCGGNNIKFNGNGNAESFLFAEINLLKFEELRAKEFFANVEALYLFDMIEDIEIGLIKNDKEMNFNGLSEGEKQFLLINTLIDIVTESETIFLLDEPDTYLHPKWQREFADIMGTTVQEGQIFMTTHSPLTLGEVNRENIYIFRNGETFKPLSNSYGRNVADILEEIMEVTPRPKEINDKISNFYKNIANGNYAEAKKELKDLKIILSENDPFIIEAELIIGG